MKIYHWKSKLDGRLNEENFRKKLERMGYRVHSYVYSPRTVFEPHFHTIDKIDAILSGKFLMEMEGVQVVLQAGDFIEVPANTIHTAKVVGDEKVISLDAVKQAA